MNNFNEKIFNQFFEIVKEKQIDFNYIKNLIKNIDFDNKESVNNYITVINKLKEIFDDVLEDFYYYKEEEILFLYYTKNNFYNILKKEYVKRLKLCLQ